MKLFTAGMFFVFSTCAAIAAEPRSNGAVPQPRPRLDPTRQTAVSTRIPETKQEANPALVLDRLVVKESSVLAERPPAVEDPKGEFTLKSGGRFLRRDAGPFRFEAGLWPSIDLFPEESRFQPTKVLIEFDFLRIKF
jgi:hypothetical protein